MITTLILVLHIIVSVLLVAAVLIQAGKGSSMANVFGGGGMETVFGAETQPVLNKITSILAIVFMVTSILLATLPGRLTTSSAIEREINRVPPPVSAPPLPQTPPAQ